MDPATDQGSRSHKSYPQDNQSEQSSKAHLEAVFGDQIGWVFIGVGTGHYVADTGKVKHKHWVERSFRWPAQTDEVVAFITEPVEAGAADVYFTPTLSENPSARSPRTPSTAASRCLCVSSGATSTVTTTSRGSTTCARRAAAG